MSSSHIDELTKLYSESYLNEKISQEIIKSNKTNKDFSIVRFDIDNFNEINKKYGFDFGNKILLQLANLFRSSIRGTDIPFRIKAEQFIILLPGIRLEDSLIFAERIRKKINETKFGDDKNQLNITTSIGVVTYTKKKGIDIEQLIQLLDACVYQAKQEGRNCIVNYLSIIPEDEEY